MTVMQDQYLAKSLSNRLQELALSLRELGGLLEDGLQYSNPKSFMRMGRDIVNLYQ